MSPASKDEIIRFILMFISLQLTQTHVRLPHRSYASYIPNGLVRGFYRLSHYYLLQRLTRFQCVYPCVGE
jgi:hypothetical protein